MRRALESEAAVCGSQLGSLFAAWPKGCGVPYVLEDREPCSFMFELTSCWFHAGIGRQVPQKPPRGSARGPPQLVLPPPPPYPPPDTDAVEPLGVPGEGTGSEASDLRSTRTCPPGRVLVIPLVSTCPVPYCGRLCPPVQLSFQC